MPLRIDSHVHIFPPWRLKSLVRWILKAYPDHPIDETVLAADILADLNRLGITHFFNLIYPLKEEETESLNDFNSEFCSQTPGAIPLASMHPETPRKAAYAEQLIRRHPFLGFKFHPFVQHFDPWDSRMASLYRFLAEIGKPVFFHTGFELFYNQKMPVAELAKLVKRFPDLPMVFVHMAFPDVLTCFELMKDYPELYLDATNVLAFWRPEYEEIITSLPGKYHLLDQLSEGLETFSHRIMYGSDHPVGMGSLADIYTDLDQGSFSEKTKTNLKLTTAYTFVNRFLPGFDWKKQHSDQC